MIGERWIYYRPCRDWSRQDRDWPRRYWARRDRYWPRWGTAGAGPGEDELVARHGEPRAAPNLFVERVDDRARERLDPAARAADQVLVVPCGDLVVPAPVVDGHAHDLTGLREPAHCSEHRRGVRRHATTPEVFLELVERPAVTRVTAHDLEDLVGEQGATTHTRQRR